MCSGHSSTSLRRKGPARRAARKSQLRTAAAAGPPGALPPTPLRSVHSVGATWPGTGTVRPSCLRAIVSMRTGDAQPGHFQLQLLIQFGRLRALAASFELIAHLDAFEMLPGVKQQAAPPAPRPPPARRQKSRKRSGAMRAHQARIINPLHGVIFGHRAVFAAVRLVGELAAVANFLGHAHLRAARARIARDFRVGGPDHFLGQHCEIAFARQPLKACFTRRSSSE